MTKRAVIDRITDGLVTLLVDEEENEMVVELNSLPSGVKEGDWLEMGAGREICSNS